MTPPAAANPFRRRLVVNLVPLLDVLAIMIFGIYLEARLAERRRLDAKPPPPPEVRPDADEIRRRDRQIRELAQALADQARRAERSEDVLRERANIAEGLEGGLGLSGREARNAMAGLPEDPAQRRELLSRLGDLKAADPKTVPAVVVHLDRDLNVRLIRRGDKGELGGFAVRRVEGDESIRLKLHEAWSERAAEFAFVLVSWDNVPLNTQQALVRAVDAEIALLAGLPKHQGRSWFRLATGSNPQGAGGVLGM
jgi:hypothetical protein